MYTIYFDHIFPLQPLSSVPLDPKTVSLLTSGHLIIILVNATVVIPLSPTVTEVCKWVWDHPLGHGQHNSSHIPQEK